MPGFVSPAGLWFGPDGSGSAILAPAEDATYRLRITFPLPPPDDLTYSVTTPVITNVQEGGHPSLWPDGPISYTPNLNIAIVHPSPYRVIAASSVGHMWHRGVFGTATNPSVFPWHKHAAGVITVTGVPSDIKYCAGGPFHYVSDTLWIVFAHCERWKNGTDSSVVRDSCALIVSTDQGQFWSFLGEIITHHIGYTQPLASSAYGNAYPYVIKNVGGVPHFYVYFRDAQVGGGVSELAVARGSVAAVEAWAAGGSVAVFTKYHAGSFSQPGLGGQSSPLEAANGPILWPEVKHCIEAGEDLLVSVKATTPPWTELVALNSLDNAAGVQWGNRQTLLVPVVASTELMYPTMINPTQPELRLIGTSFYLYMLTSPTGGGGRQGDAYIQRSTVTVIGIGAQPAAIKTGVYRTRVVRTPTKGATLHVRRSLGVTPTSLYKILGAHLPAEAALYRVLATLAKFDEGRYLIAGQVIGSFDTPLGIAYRFRIITDRTHSARYRARAVVTITRLGQVRVHAPHDRTLAGFYRMLQEQSSISPTRSGLYRMRRTISKTSSGLYRVRAARTLIIPENYRIRRSLSLTPPGMYFIGLAPGFAGGGALWFGPSSTESLLATIRLATGTYRVRRTISPTQAGQYRFASGLGLAITRLGSYTVDAVTMGFDPLLGLYWLPTGNKEYADELLMAAYGLRVETSATRSATVRVRTAWSIGRGGLYRLRAITVATAQGTYRTRSTASITRTATSRVKVTRTAVRFAQWRLVRSLQQTRAAFYRFSTQTLNEREFGSTVRIRQALDQLTSALWAMQRSTSAQGQGMYRVQGTLSPTRPSSTRVGVGKIADWSAKYTVDAAKTRTPEATYRLVAATVFREEFAAYQLRFEIDQLLTAAYGLVAGITAEGAYRLAFAGEGTWSAVYQMVHELETILSAAWRVQAPHDSSSMTAAYRVFTVNDDQFTAAVRCLRTVVDAVDATLHLRHVEHQTASAAWTIQRTLAETVAALYQLRLSETKSQTKAATVRLHHLLDKTAAALYRLRTTTTMPGVGLYRLRRTVTTAVLAVSRLMPTRTVTRSAVYRLVLALNQDEIVSATMRLRPSTGMPATGRYMVHGSHPEVQLGQYVILGQEFLDLTATLISAEVETVATLVEAV